MEFTRQEIIELLEEAVAKGIERYMAMHPRPPWVSYRQAEMMLHRSPPYVRAMIRDGRIGLNQLGKIPIEEIDRLLATSRKKYDEPERTDETVE